MAPNNNQMARMRTAQVIAKMKERNYDALDELITMAKQAKDNDDYDTRLDIAKTLMPYIYPKLKHVEVDAQVNHGLTVHVRNFIKQESIIDGETYDRPVIPATDNRAIEERGKETLQLRTSGDDRGTEISGADLLAIASLPVSAGGHPDVIPDPSVPEKRQKMSPW